MLRDANGNPYKFSDQQLGTFILAKDDQLGFEVQSTNEPLGNGTTAIRQMRFKVAGREIFVNGLDDPTIDGQVVKKGETVQLSNEGETLTYKEDGSIVLDTKYLDNTLTRDAQGFMNNDFSIITNSNQGLLLYDFFTGKQPGPNGEYIIPPEELNIFKIG